MDIPFQPVFAHNPAAEYFLEEGCYILENLNAPADPTVSIARARVLPGTSTHWHLLKGTTERYLITAGEGIVEVGDFPPTSVKPGDVILIPADVRQRIHNRGEEDLVFYCICSPRFVMGAYVQLD